MHLIFRSACIAMAVPATALAGAFNEPAGHAQVILSDMHSNAGQYWTADGATRLPVSYAMHEQSLLMQFGITNRLMGIVKASRINASGAPGLSFEGRGTTDIGAQWKIATIEGYLISMKGLLHLPAQGMKQAAWLFGPARPEAEVRLLVGKAFHVAGHKGFLDLQTGYRLRTDGLGREWHYDMTSGLELTPTLTLMTQTFSTQAAATPANAYALYEQRKKQVSLVRDFGPFSLQLGVFRTISGRRSYVERGTLLSMWMRL